MQSEIDKKLAIVCDDSSDVIKSVLTNNVAIEIIEEVATNQFPIIRDESDFGIVNIELFNGAVRISTKYTTKSSKHSKARQQRFRARHK